MPQAIKIGTENIAIDPITGWKFLEAAQLIAELTEQLPDLYREMEEFRENRIKTSTRTYTKAAALAQFGDRLTRVSDEDWERLGNVLELPGEPPSQQEQVAQVFPKALKNARPLVGRLLASLAVPNTELEAAVAAGGDGLAEKIREWENKLLMTGTVSNLVRFIVAAIEAFRTEAEADEEVKRMVGKLGGLLSTADEAGQTAMQGTQDTPEPQQNATSSTSAPGSSDGTPAQPSTPLSGASSEPSTPASAGGG